jgi:hypothetical protein
MPDKRKHRGAAPRDRELFAPEIVPALRAAVGDLGWLLERGYAEPGARKLVGDRYGLNGRQQEALRRGTCAPSSAASRRGKDVLLAALSGEGGSDSSGRSGALSGAPVAVDGFNALITVEAALSGGLIVVGADGAWRDLASVHGTWRAVSETPAAITLAGEALARLGAGPVTWLLDRPVSNSGRLRGKLLAVAEERGWDWQVDLPGSADPVVADFDGVSASNDAYVIDRCARWLDLPRAVIQAEAPDAWILDLS